MSDERMSAEVDPDGQVPQSHESAQETIPAGGFSAAEMDDIVWEVFGTGL